MKNIFKKIFTGSVEIKLPYFTLNLPDLWIPAVAAVISVISFIIFYRLDTIVAYNDARAHMNMARLVVDNLKPGLAQIGSVWLPLDHLLKLTLVWNDFLWQSGLAGSVWSMLSYVATVYVVYLFIKHALKSKVTALLGTLLFATNLNVLYMQSTPMTELLLLLFFTTASYSFYKWTENKKTINLILPSFWVFLATLTRYDGWFLLAMMLGALFVITFKEFLKNKSVSFGKRTGKFITTLEGRLILFGVLGGLGIVAWVIWNLLIFNDPLYFAYGPYSAHAQQAKIEAAGSLISKHDVLLSLKIYWLAMVDNIGFVPMILASIGLAFYAYSKRVKDHAIAAYTLLSPFAFHVISLILGFSILVVPELGVKITQEASASWFNVRYGLMMLPAVAFFASYLVRKSLLLKFVLLAVIVLQFHSFYASNNIITLTDGVIGTSSLNVKDVRDYLIKNAKDREGLILTSIAFNNALAFSTGIKLDRFIHEGTGDYWTNALTDPRREAKWIVMANGDVGDQVYESLVKKNNNEFLRHYTLAYRGKHTNVYVRKDDPKDFVVSEGGSFSLNNRDFKFIGVNSYDLAYRSEEEIDQTMRLASQNGIKVIRFWAFGEGREDGFQPTEGKYNQEKLQKLAYIVDRADKYNLKLIVTLSNYWSDYGGVPQYLDWQGLPSDTNKDFDAFYTNEKIQNVFKNYLKTVITYESPINQRPLSKQSAIMAWEVMNEPRSSVTSKSQIVVDWMKEISNYTLALDPNHIVTLGTEGFTPIYNTGDTGPFLADVGDIAPGALPTAHYYVQYEKQKTSTVIKDWAIQVKRNNNKPLIIGEVGFDKLDDEGKSTNRELKMQEFLDSVLKERIDGVVLWNWALKEDDSFGISPLDKKDEKVLKIIKNYSESISR